MVECVLGLGPNLFYNSPMEACVVICRSNKPSRTKGKTLFIDAVHEIVREGTQSFLRPEHQNRILEAYRAFANEPEFAHVATTDEILAKEGDLTVHHHVTRKHPIYDNALGETPAQVWERFDRDGREFWAKMDALVEIIDESVAREADNV